MKVPRKVSLKTAFAVIVAVWLSSMLGGITIDRAYGVAPTASDIYNNNISIQWKDSAGTARDALYLDALNNFNIGGAGITAIVLAVSANTVTLQPTTDNVGALGISTKRYSQLNLDTSIGVQIWNNPTDANALSQLTGTALKFGPGGAGALDVALSRASATAFNSNAAFQWNAAATPAAGQAAVGADASAGNVLLNAPTGKSVYATVNGATVLQVAGAAITASQLVTFLSTQSGIVTTVRMSSDATNTGATYATTGLSITLAASTNYVFHVMVPFTNSGGSSFNLKVKTLGSGWAAPQTNGVCYGGGGAISTVAATDDVFSVQAANTALLTSDNTAGGVGFAIFDGTITSGTSSTTLEIDFANPAAAGTATVKAGGTMWVSPVA